LINSSAVLVFVTYPLTPDAASRAEPSARVAQGAGFEPPFEIRMDRNSAQQNAGLTVQG